jgi:hypothetical protein
VTNLRPCDCAGAAHKMRSATMAIANLAGQTVLYLHNGKNRFIGTSPLFDLCRDFGVGCPHR